MIIKWFYYGVTYKKKTKKLNILSINITTQPVLKYKYEVCI